MIKSADDIYPTENVSWKFVRHAVRRTSRGVYESAKAMTTKILRIRLAPLPSGRNFHRGRCSPISLTFGHLGFFLGLNCGAFLLSWVRAKIDLGFE